ncbi:MAG: serine/threonine-protein kinase [Myxococcota bacterium]|nr:serine/threonine-protein kinase [Myxococcota bacterium]
MTDFGSGEGQPPRLTSLVGGRTIGPYRVEEMIGSGGMATVFRCRDMRNGNEYALKLLASNLARREKVVRRFRQEASIQSRISHPGIVHVFDLVEDGANIALVMEYVRGETLDRWLARLGRAATTDECCNIFVPLLDALEHAHRGGVVHRDLKPSNVLLQAVPVPAGMAPKIADFGVAKVLDEAGVRTATGAQLGTAWYMAPEQCRGARQVDHRADLYAVGVMLFEAAVRALPFDGDSEYAVMEGHARQAPPRPSMMNPTVDPGVEAIVLRALEKRPDDRFDSATTFGAALQAVRRYLDAGIAPGRPSAGAPGTSGGGSATAGVGRARRRWIIAAAASVLAGVGLAVILAWARIATHARPAGDGGGHAQVGADPATSDTGVDALEVAGEDADYALPSDGRDPRRAAADDATAAAEDVLVIDAVPGWSPPPAGKPWLSLRPGFQPLPLSPPVSCVFVPPAEHLALGRKGGVLVTARNESGVNGFCAITVDFDLFDRRTQVATRQRMQRVVWLRGRGQTKLGFMIASQAYVVTGATVYGSPGAIGESTGESALADYSPRANCVLRDGEISLRERDDAKVLEVRAVSRSSQSGYCEVVAHFDVTDTEMGIRGRQEMRRVLRVDPGPDTPVSLKLPGKYRVNNAAARTE